MHQVGCANCVRNNTDRLEMELSARRIELVLLVDPLELAKLRVKRALLQPAQLKCKPRPDLLQTRLLLVLECIPMVPYEDKVALVVERHDLVAFELRLVLK